jgi:hypothetical protein
VTVKLVALVAVPPGVVTRTRPLVAPCGTENAICVGDFTLNAARVPLSETAVAPEKPDPFSVMVVPTGPLVGVKELIVGAAGAVTTVKLVVLVAVPAGVVMLMGPLPAVAGTVAVIWLALLTV